VPAVEPSETVALCEMAPPGARVNVAARLALPAAVKNELESARATAGSSTAWLTLEAGVKDSARQPVTALDTPGDASVMDGCASEDPVVGAVSVTANGLT